MCGQMYECITEGSFDLNEDRVDKIIMVFNRGVNECHPAK